uniref:DH domain-containing protein n=1 Tax=Kwoniella dejecticola CBS 10117 TaxID=1296121 RepID=A0A1A5ZXQ3_9TREE|nr:uncharacterized protein I303_07351 [Kwoniella dejecticola CBS 10117]OBR82589.1 hypothetical protein I303_07351 [Kwoniella dejecticola CBS 10117]
MRLIKRRSSQNLPSSSKTTGVVPPLPGQKEDSSHNDVATVPSPTKGGGKGKKRRDSQEMKYPPTSFGQSSTGWSFGRMRSLKSRSRSNSDAGVSESEDEGLGEGRGKGKLPELYATRNTNPAQITLSLEVDRSEQALPSPLPSPPRMVFPDIDTPDFTTSPPESPFPSMHPAYPQPNQPIIAFSSPESPPTPVSALATAQSSSIFAPSGSRPPLNSALSASTSSSAPSIASGESSHPLIARNDGGPSSGRAIATSTAPRKLTKRRPVSMMHDQVELVERPSVSSDGGSLSSPQNYVNPAPAQIYTVLTGPVTFPLSFLTSLPLPEGAAPPSHILNWPLNRNPSCSTNASSGMTPSTDESGMLETPNNAVIIPGQGEDRLWERIGEPRPPLSRASTFSYREGDDGTIVKREGYFHHKSARDASSSSQDTAYVNGPLRPATQDTYPIVPPNVSTGTYTPTVSSASDVTAKIPRSLRISTSNLELKSNQVEPLVSPTASVRKRSVAFEKKPLAPEQSAALPQEDQPRPVRPPLMRLRSSSMGAMSVNTNSVYSVGEVAVATSAKVTKAQALVIGHPPQDDQTGGVAELLAELENSSEAVRRAFDQERQRGDWPAANDKNALEQPAKRVHNARPAPPPPRLLPAKKLSAGPTPSPILRSASTAASPKKLVSFHSTAEGDIQNVSASQGSAPSKRPTMPSRSSSFSRLWRKLSTSGYGGNAKKGKSFDNLDNDIPPVPQTKKDEWYGALTESPTKTTSNNLEDVMSSRIKRSRGSLDLTSVGKENPDFLSLPTRSSFTKDKDRPSTPSSTSSRRSKGKKRLSLTSIPPPRAQSVPLSLPIRSDTPPVIPPLSPTPPLGDPLPSPTSLTLDSDNTVCLTHASTASTTDVTVRSFRKIPAAEGSKNWRTPLGPYTPPLSAIVNDYFRDLKSASSSSSHYHSELFTREITLHRTSLHEDAEYQSYDAKRRYRQSLVEIKDDEAFQATVEQLVKLESDGRVRMTRAGGAALRGDMPPIYRTPSKDLSEKQIRQENIRAWFVTRELVQGERRHGRLLAKGVAAVQLAIRSQTSIPPVPPIPSSDMTVAPPLTSPRHTKTPGHSRSGSGNFKTPSRLRRSRTSTPGPSAISASSPTTPILPTISLPPSASAPLEALSEKLPKLYELSVELSQRFEHDPSPYGVADAFVSMEESIILEISSWAKEIGEIVYSGIGDEMNKILDQHRIKDKSRRRRSEGGLYESGAESEVKSEAEGGEGRLRFADIIIVPIQRASRYKLLFQGKSTVYSPLPAGQKIGIPI